MNSPALIVLLVFSIITIVATIGFNFIFIFKRINSKTELKLKIKYDYYKSNLIGSNLKSIETLVKKNNELSPILEYLRDYNTQYTNQLEIVKTQIQNVSKEIHSFKIIQTHKKLKQISGNFDLLDKQRNEFKQFNLDTQKFSNNSSLIATDLFKVLSSVNEFGKNNLFDVLHAEVTKLKSINDQVNKISIHINEELNYINSTVIHKLFLDELLLIKDLYNTSKNIFDIDKYQFAFNALFNKIKETLKNTKLPNEIRVTVAKRLNTSKINIDNITDLLKVAKFDEAKKIFLNELTTLEKILSNIKADEAYQNTYEKYFQEFKMNIASFYDLLSKNNIKDIYKEITINFKGDKEIVGLIYSNIELTKKIHANVNKLNNFINKKEHLLDVKTTVKFISEIYQELLLFKNENERLLKLIHVQHKNFFLLITKFNDLDLKLLDLKKILLQNNIKNEVLMHDIESNINLISKIKASLISGAVKTDENFESQINNVDNFIIKSIDVIKTDINLISIVKRLKLYSNRYYNLATKQQMDIFDELYREQKYQALIQEYIVYIQKMKKQKRVS
ncbi:MAG: hypothetical protein ACRC4M_02225 [Mycoplasma sp.]